MRAPPLPAQPPPLLQAAAARASVRAPSSAPARLALPGAGGAAARDARARGARGDALPLPPRLRRAGAHRMAPSQRGSAAAWHDSLAARQRRRAAQLATLPPPRSARRRASASTRGRSARTATSGRSSGCSATTSSRSAACTRAPSRCASTSRRATARHGTARHRTLAPHRRAHWSTDTQHLAAWRRDPDATRAEPSRACDASRRPIRTRSWCGAAPSTSCTSPSARSSPSPSRSPRATHCCASCGRRRRTSSSSARPPSEPAPRARAGLLDVLVSARPRWPEASLAAGPLPVPRDSERPGLSLSRPAVPVCKRRHPADEARGRVHS